MLRPTGWVVFVSLVLQAGHGQASVQSSPLSFLGSDKSQDEILSSMAEGVPVQFKPIGNTSAVFRMRLSPPPKAAYKPRTRELRHGYQAEIAAYRIARLLDFDNVPPAISKRAGRVQMKQKFHPEQLSKWPRSRRAILWDDDGTVPGAAIYWIPKLRELELDKQQKRWLPWLSQQGTVPDARENLTRDLSNVIVFDHVIANWDRYSGGNMKGHPSGERLFIRDHDRAFGTPVSPKIQARLKSRLIQVQRFSRSTVERLAALDERTLRAELAKDPSHAKTPLLTDLQIAVVLERRATVLSHVAALVEEYGTDRVLTFE